jgi:hypothetical protein
MFNKEHFEFMFEFPLAFQQIDSIRFLFCSVFLCYTYIARGPSALWNFNLFHVHPKKEICFQMLPLILQGIKTKGIKQKFLLFSSCSHAVTLVTIISK